MSAISTTSWEARLPPMGRLAWGQGTSCRPLRVVGLAGTVSLPENGVGHFGRAILRMTPNFVPTIHPYRDPGLVWPSSWGDAAPPPRHALESKCGNLSKFLSKLNCLFKPPPPSTPNLPHTTRQLKQCRGRGFLPKMAICKPRRTAAGPPHVPPWGRSGGPPPPCPGKPAVVERTGVF